MALKAGYKGIKKVSGSLKLTPDGVLSSDGSSINLDYSSTEKDTGIKWLDSEKIYAKTYTIPNAVTTGTVIDDTWNTTYKLLWSEATAVYEKDTTNRTILLPFSTPSMYTGIEQNNSTGKPIIYIQSNNSKFTDYVITLYYTKTPIPSAVVDPGNPPEIVYTNLDEDLVTAKKTTKKTTKKEVE